jgi:hypothetical protein
MSQDIGMTPNPLHEFGVFGYRGWSWGRRAVGVVAAGEGVQQGLELGDSDGPGLWAASHFFRVCQNRSTLPWVWDGSACRSSAAPPCGPVRAPGRCGRGGRLRRTGRCRPYRMSVKVEAGAAMAARKVASTTGPVTWCQAVTDSAIQMPRDGGDR